MDISFFESLIYGFVSGMTEFMPVSSSAHEQIVLRLFGINSVHPLMQLFIHIGVLISLYFACKNHLQHMSREDRLRKIPKRRRKRQPDPKIVMDAAFLKTACFPLLIGFVFYLPIMNWENRLPVSAAFLLINGLVLHIPMYFAGGNKDSRSMTRLDGLIFGAISALGMIPGLSRIGIASGYASVRAADYGQTYKWCLLLSIPAILAISVFDIVMIFTTGLAGVGFVYFLQCLLSGGLAYLGATISIRFVRSLAAKAGLSGFSYYCWGAALFSFVLYLCT